MIRSRLVSLLRPIAAVLAGLALGLAVTRIAGESPWHVLMVLGKSAFGSSYDLGMTLFYATPLMLTGLSVAVAFHAGLFNIGAEGQLTLGALAAAAVGICFPAMPAWCAPVVGTLAAALAGGLWGGLAGWLRARRGAHEVITTIMLNFVAAGLASYATLYLLKDPDSQSAESRLVGAHYLIHHFAAFGDAPVSSALLLACVAAAAASFMLDRTVAGYELKAVGESEEAAATAGVDPGRVRIHAMFVAGALAGLVGVGEVFGNAGRFRLGFSPDYGFIGIAVALLGRNRPLGVVLSALLFGALHKGASDLDLETENVTRDLSLILQALIILSVSADGLWGGKWLRKLLSGRLGKAVRPDEGTP
jgi:simple sugar transport system permease protein